jgi:hypothetical protein
MYPAVIKANNSLELPDTGTWHPQNITGALLRHKDPKVKAQFPKEEIEKLYAENDSPEEQIQALRDLIRSKGYDSIKYKNRVEDPGHTSYIILHPSQARSPWAAFDPEKASSGNLLAGLAGGAAIPLAAQHKDIQDFVKALYKQ